MFSIRYLEKSKETPNGQIFSEISEESSWIYEVDSFPFKFEVAKSGIPIFTSDLYPNTWASWHCEENENIESFIRNKEGEIISYFKLDIWTNRNSTEQFFDTWVSKKRNPNGIIIGTHDGKTGEWVKHVREGRINPVLVEGSQNQFDKLIKNYSDLDQIKFRREIVTGDSREVEFYEFGQGYTNTLDEDHFKKHFSEGDFRIIKTKSIGINDLIIEEGLQDSLDFLHLDTESIDDEIIMSLDFNRVKKPELVIFETINFSEERTGSSERMTKLFDWFFQNGYLVKYDFWNSFAYLKK